MTRQRLVPPSLHRSGQQGVALVELALVLPLLIVLSVLVTDFGRAFYQYNTLAKALRDAVRYLSVQDPAVVSTDTAKITAARNLVVYGMASPPANAQPLVPGLNLSHVPASNIAWTWTGTSPNYLMVSIRVSGFNFQPMIAQVFGLRLGNAQGVIPFGPMASHMRAPE